MERPKLIGAAIAVTLMSATGIYWWQSSGSDVEQAKPEGTAKRPGDLTPQQAMRLGIQTEAAVTTSEVGLGVVPGTITLPPEARVAVTAPFAGAVTRLYVVNGEAVAKGQPLAIIRSREPVQYGAALARGQAQLAVTQAEAARTNQLAREGIIAGSRADMAQAAMRQAQVDVSENRRILAQAGAGASGEFTLRAPITGRLAAVNVQTGGPVDGMTAPFVVENTANFMIDLQIPERLAGDVLPGMEVTVAIGQSEPIKGNIISVGSSIDPATRSLIAKARIGSSPQLVSGKSVMVTLLGNKAIVGASVASSAVTRIGDKDVVFVASGNRFVIRSVIVAGRNGNRITLSEGLKPGEKVATSGISELKVILGEQ